MSSNARVYLADHSKLRIFDITTVLQCMEHRSAFKKSKYWSLDEKESDKMKRGEGGQDTNNSITSSKTRDHDA